MKVIFDMEDGTKVETTPNKLTLENSKDGAVNLTFAGLGFLNFPNLTVAPIPATGSNSPAPTPEVSTGDQKA